MFSFIGKSQTVSQSDFTRLHSHQQSMFPLLHIIANIWWSVFFISASLVGVKCSLIVSLVWTSLLTNDIGPLFVCLSDILTSHSYIFFRKVSVQDFCSFLIGLFYLIRSSQIVKKKKKKRSSQIVFQRGFNVLHKQGVFQMLHILANMWCVLILAVLVGMKWNAISSFLRLLWPL